MGKLLEKPQASLYERDFYAWTLEQADKLRARAHNEIDWENAAEEIESVGRSQKNEIRSRLGVLLKHLLKWEHQSGRRSHGWQGTISEQRIHIQRALATSPSLGRFPAEVFEQEYQWARKSAARETGLPILLFPEAAAFDLGMALDEDFLPGAPWSPDDLLRD